MPLIKNISAISFSSQDDKHTLYGLLSSKTSWLSSPKDRSGKITADLQLPKAISISYIDIGNHNSTTLSIEVSRSSGGVGLPLLPTVMLCSPQQLRGQDPATKAVRMFKTVDLNQESVFQKWDRIKVTCYQPFKKDIQFGLSFLKFHTSESDEQIPTPTTNNKDNSSLESINRIPAFPRVNKNVSEQSNFLRILKGKCLNKSSLDTVTDKPIIKQSKKSDNDILISLDKLNAQKRLSIKTPSSINKSLDDSVNITKRNKPNYNSSEITKTSVNYNTSAIKNINKSRNFLSKVDKRNKENEFSRSSNSIVKEVPSPRTPTAEDTLLGLNDKNSGSKEQTEFEYESLEFLISLELDLQQIFNLKVSDVRRQFEVRRGSALAPRQKKFFKDIALDFCNRRIDLLQNSMKWESHGKTVHLEDETVEVPSNSICSSVVNNRIDQNRSYKNKHINSPSIDSSDPSIVNLGASTSKSQSKYTFKRSADSDNTNEFADFKKAKYRAENSMADVPKKSPLHQNKLCVFDSQYFSDYDTPPSSQDSEVIKPKTLRLSSTPRSSKNTSKLKDATKLKDVPKDRTGVWLSTRENSLQRSDVSRPSGGTPDIEVEHVQEIESQLSNRKETSNFSNSRTSSNFSNQEHHSLLKHVDGEWINLSNKKNNSISSTKFHKRSQITNAGSSTVVILDGEEDVGGCSTVSRSALTPSVSIGMLSSSNLSTSASTPTLSAVEGTGYTLGRPPGTEKRSVTSNFEIELPDQDLDTVQCPICSEHFPANDIEHHAGSCGET